MEAPGTITTEPIRQSKRLQGLPPEFGLLPDPVRRVQKMADEGNQKTPAGTSTAANIIPSIPIVTYQLPRSPCIFTGDSQQDANRWLKDFDRISAYNRWDDQMCLANVIFYLAGTARQWFDNNEDTFTNWSVFRESLKSTFCRAADIKRLAERQLLTRAQQNGETSESYIQDVLALCRKANPSMCVFPSRNNISTFCI